jgi:hypothetical protein
MGSMTGFCNLCRLGVALAVVLLVTIGSRPSVDHITNGGITKQSVSATPIAACDADEAESGIDLQPSGPPANDVAHDPELTTSLRPAHTTPFGRGRHAFLLTTRLRC